MRLTKWKAVCCNANGEWAEFTMMLDDSKADHDAEFIKRIEKEGYSIACMYRPKDVVLKKRF